MSPELYLIQRNIKRDTWKHECFLTWPCLCPQVKLTFEEAALMAIARMALKNKTGARGLRAIMERILKDTMYEVPGTEVHEVVIHEDIHKPEYVTKEAGGEETETPEQVETVKHQQVQAV